jgi:MFS family permease
MTIAFPYRATLRSSIRTRVAASTRPFVLTARNPSLLRAQLAFGVAWTADWAFTVALGVVAFREGGAAAVGIVGFLRMAPSTFLVPVGAAFADRFRRDRVLLWSCLVRTVATAALAFTLAAGGETRIVYALAVVATGALSVFRPAHQALLPGLCRTPNELTNANVVRGFIESLSTLIGPLAAAFLLAFGSAPVVFALAAALALVSAVLLVGLPYEAPPRRAREPLRRIAGETVEGFRAIRRSRSAGILAAVGLAQTLTNGFLNVFMVVVAIQLLHLGASGVGVLTAAMGIGSLAGSLATSTLVTRRRLAVIQGIGVALWGISLTLTGALPYPPAVLLLMGVIGVGNTLGNIGICTVVPRLVPEELLGRVFGAIESLIVVTLAVGAFVTPLVIDLLGLRGALLVLGLVSPAAAALAWRGLRAIDASIGRQDDAIDVLSKVEFLRPLPMPAIDALALSVAEVSLVPGQAVFHQDDLCDGFHVIEQGEVDVIGDGHVIRTMGPGDGFGEIALLEDRPRTTTVRARTPLRLLSLDRLNFVKAIEGYESSAREAARVVKARLDSFEPRVGSSGLADPSPVVGDSWV